MNFDLTEDQQLLVETVGNFVRRDSPVTRFRELRDDPIGYSRKVWKQMGEFGWLGVMLPESVGGSGGSFVDVALILEQLGSTLVPEPLLTSLVAAVPLLRLGSAAQKERWLAPLAAGDATLALAHTEVGSRHEPACIALAAEKDGTGYRLRGEKRFVVNGHAADALVVSARTSGAPGDAQGVTLFVLPREAPGLRVQPVKTIDGQRAAMLTFDVVAVGSDARLGAEGEGLFALEEALDLGAAGCCAEGAGLLRRVLEMTCDYLRTREQFGVKIGSFQALQHRAVDMFVEVELCKSTAIMAAIRQSEALAGKLDAAERKSAISAAKVQLAVGGRFVTQQAIQLHGGIGITDEHDVGLYFKRMHVLGTLFGDEEHHVARFSRLPGFTAGIEPAAA